jgi:hypothetical protein
MDERRRKVAALYLRHVDQEDIARQLGVDQSTVSRDVAALRSDWRSAAGSDTAEHIAVEVAELDLMERDAALEFSKTHDPRWMTVRLSIKDRRAALLGLDAPKRTELTGRNGGPIDIAGHPEWVMLRTVILETLTSFPEAHAALAETFLGFEDGQDRHNGHDAA